ncbi:MAG TPA: Crp/Fnr family transcriptional regulator [Pyrinomonadaceae bacterium]|nr:Crp/Fnr family transcriptional regulator [Pyrinomonadaceae bacterium]
MTKTAKPLNRLLAALPKTEYNLISSRLVHTPLVYNASVYEPGDEIKHVYFPDSGIISLLSAVDTDSTLEVGIVGNEGLAGLPVFLGVTISSNRAVVQGAGVAQRMSVKDFRAACKKSQKLTQLIQRYVHSLLTQISQSAVCNRYHHIDARLSRWLLMTHDRMRTDEFQITQEFLSNMLGVRREAVNKAAGDLQRQSLIKYSRGSLSVINRTGLEKAACPCYKIIRKEYEIV